MRAFRVMFIANCKEFLRDGGLIFLSFIFPVILALIFGVVFGESSKNNINDLSIGITNGQGQIYEQIIEHYGKNKIINGSEEEEIEAVEKGDRDIVFVLPDVSYQEAQNYSIKIVYDHTNDFITDELLSNIRHSFIEIEDSLMGNNRKVTVDFSRISEVGNVSTFSYIFPGILSMTLMQLGLYGCLEYLKQRDTKVLRSLSVTPLSRSALLSSDLLLRVLIGFAEAVIILSIGYFIFGLEIRGSLLALSLLILLGALTFTSIGYLLVSLSNSALTGNVLVQIVTMIMVFLSGIFFKASSMPSYLKPVMRILPLTYFGDAMRQVMLGVSGAYSMQMNITVLLVSLVVSSLLSIKLWKWE